MFEFLNKPIAYNSNIKIKYIVYPLLALFILIFGSCSFNKSFKRVTIDAGTIGVVVAKPVFFGQNGVTGKTMTPGSYWAWKSNEIHILPTTPMEVTEKFDDMFTSDNIPVDFDMQANFVITDYTAYVKNWGDKWYNNSVKKTFRAAGREECKRHKMNELVTDPEVPEKAGNNILQELVTHTAAIKAPIKFTNVTIDNISPNDNVKNEIGATAIQQQRQKTEGEKKKAEDMRRATEVARASADNAYREAMNLAPEQYIRLEAVKAYSHAAEACAKNPNCTMILTQPGNDVKATIPAR